VKPYPHGAEWSVTNTSPFDRQALSQPSVPKGDVFGTYETYLEAQGVVDKLAKADFDVKNVSIVGNDLKTVERVTGKLTYGRAAGAGAATGAYFGLFFGIMLILFSPTTSLSLVAAAALIGAGFGMIFRIVTYSIGRRRRDFTSTSQVLASNYQIIVDPDVVLRARDALERADQERAEQERAEHERKHDREQ
jgi:hypothetical protein